MSSLFYLAAGFFLLGAFAGYGIASGIAVPRRRGREGK
jgi:hypothetical protein